MSYLYNNNPLVFAVNKIPQNNISVTNTNYLINGIDSSSIYLSANNPLITLKTSMGTGSDGNILYKINCPYALTNNNMQTQSVFLNNSVRALAFDLTNNVLYAGGTFTTIGGIAANRIAKWDVTTSSWSALGTGTDLIVTSLAFDSTNNVLYAGGTFTIAGGVTVNYIAKWDVVTSSWSALGSGMSTNVTSLAFDSTNNVLYAGGGFITAGGVTVNYIAKWTVSTSTWSALGSGMSTTVNALAFDSTNNVLYAGGTFTTIGGVSVKRIAKWDVSTSTWSALGSGADFTVSALAFDSNNNLLYAGGSFTTIGGVTANRIAKWDGSSWIAMSYFGYIGLNTSNVLALAFDSNNKVLYTGCQTASSPYYSQLVKWINQTTTWETLYNPSYFTGFNSAEIYSFAFDSTNNVLYAGGNFIFVGNILVNCIAKWNGTTWSPLIYNGIAGIGTALVNNAVYTLTFDSIHNVLYVGGQFTSAGGVTVNNIAKWTVSTSTWSALGSGMSTTVYGLTFDSTNNVLYAGGNFTTAGGVTVNNIAKWTVSTSTWSALGSGNPGTVIALAFDSTNNVLYAGGTFTTAGGVTANRIAKWTVNSSAWSALGSGISSTVYGLTFNSTNNVLYAVGNFATAGGVTANNIAKWNGTTWSALTYNSISGINAIATSLALDSTNNLLYVGGQFTSAGGVTVNYIAKWNVATSSWSPVDFGSTIKPISVVVNNMLFVNNNIYVGINIGDVTTPYIIGTFNNVSACYKNLNNNNNLYYYNN